MCPDSNLRPSPLAGKWYPSNPLQLSKEVDACLNAAQVPAIDGEIVAVMAPHAGHLYSGPVAGYAFAPLRGMTFDVITIIAPMHYPCLEPILTSAHSAYATPLGTISVHHSLLKSLNDHLRKELGFGLVQVACDLEHSVEIELPFLQRVLTGEFKLVPIMVRDQSETTMQALGRALAQTHKGLRSLFVASSDLSHFYPQKMAEILDAEFLRQVKAFDPSGVLQVEEEGKGFACGRAAIAAVLWAAKELGADQVQILRHATSGDVTGDYEQVVGYGAAVITRQAK